MSYTGFITIIDDEGNNVFERDMEPDEIIKILLDGYTEATSNTEEPVEVVSGSISIAPIVIPDKPTTSTRKKKACGKCGVEGHNAKTCTRAQEVVEEMKDETAAWKAGKEKKRKEDLQKRIKRMVDGGMNSEEIKSQMKDQNPRELEELIAYAQHGV